MDYRLDLFNAVKNYGENVTPQDSLMVICHNSKEHDFFMVKNGDDNLLSALMTNESDYITMSNEESEKLHKTMQRTILNIAINILRTHEKYRNDFSETLASFNNA